MLKVASRKDLPELDGKKAPPLAPVVPMVDHEARQLLAEVHRLVGAIAAPVERAPAPAPDFSQLQASIVTLAKSMVRTNEIVAQQALLAAQPAKPKQLEAVVHRNAKGQMEKIIVTVVQGAA